MVWGAGRGWWEAWAEEPILCHSLSCLPDVGVRGGETKTPRGWEGGRGGHDGPPLAVSRQRGLTGFRSRLLAAHSPVMSPMSPRRLRSVSWNVAQLHPHTLQLRTPQGGSLTSPDPTISHLAVCPPFLPSSALQALHGMTFPASLTRGPRPHAPSGPPTHSAHSACWPRQGGLQVRSSVCIQIA